jgi:hypothetical protein
MTYENIERRTDKNFIGFNIGTSDLTSNKNHFFIFDKYSITNLEKIHQNNNIIKFIIKSTLGTNKSHLMKCFSGNEKNSVQLVIEHIKKSI